MKRSDWLSCDWIVEESLYVRLSIARRNRKAAPNPTGNSSSRKSADDYFDQVYFHYARPAERMAGLHQYDAQLEDFSRKSIDAEIAALKSFEQQIEAIQSRRLARRLCAAQRSRDRA